MNKKVLFLIVVIAAFGWLVWQSGIFNAVIFSGKKVETEVYFGNSVLDPETDCQTVFPVKRLVSAEAPARPSLEELFVGPSESEKAAGYFTSIPIGVKINSLKIENNVVYVDLSEELEKGAGGSCRVAAIRFQITKTLKQFSSISSVVISINGRVEDILQP
jgi:spore germination protein GerM